jgi:hypothetical protein
VVSLLLPKNKKLKNELLEKSGTGSQGDEGAGVATNTEIDRVIGDILATKKLSFDKTNFTRILLTICHLMQIGATSPKFAETRAIADYEIP